MKNLYLVEEMSLRGIAKELNISKSTVKKLLINCAVPIRTREEQCNTARHKSRQQEITQRVSLDPKERERRSQHLKAKWLDIEWREDALRKRKETWDNDPDLRQNARDRMKNRWQDIDYIVGQKMSAEASWQNPSIREKKINGMIEANKRPEVIEKKRAATQKSLKNPLYHLELRKYSRQYWSNPENRERHSIIMQEVARRPGYKEAVSKGLKEYWEGPGRKEHRAIVSAAIWTRPGMREQITRSLIKNWNERLRLKSILWGFDKKLPAFSKEEETNFVKMVIRGNNKEKYEFFCRNMGLAEKLAWRIWQNIAIIFPDYDEMDVNLEVIKQKAYMALGKAIKEYDPKRFGTTFSTLAYISVPQKIIRALHNCGRLVRVPINAVGVYDGNVLRSPLYIDGIKPEDDEEPSDGFSIFHTEQTLRQQYPQDDSIPNFNSEEDIVGFIKERVSGLPKRQEDILRLRISGLTYKEIGLIMRVSKQRIHQIIQEIAVRASITIKELA